MATPAMNDKSSWDFRDHKELVASEKYNREGYLIEEANFKYLEFIKNELEKAYLEFASIKNKDCKRLERAHFSISHEDSNDLRLHIMDKIYQNTSFHRNYYNAAKHIIHSPVETS